MPRGRLRVHQGGLDGPAWLTAKTVEVCVCGWCLGHSGDRVRGFVCCAFAHVR